MKKTLIISLVLIEALVVFLGYNAYKSKTDVLDDIIVKDNSSNMFAVYTETSAGSGTYEVYNNNTFPTTGYSFNTTKSGCVDSNEIIIPDALSYSNNKVIITTKKTANCYLYFDRLTPVIIYTPVNLNIYSDANEINAFVPINSMYTDSNARTEMVYPASLLNVIESGEEITGLTFYSNMTDKNWENTQFDIYLTSYPTTTISDFVSSSTLVYTGPLNIDSNGVMNIMFDNAYTYNGGNLLIGTYANNSTEYFMNVSWYGVTVTGASIGSIYNGAATQRNFLPKVTITYTIPGVAYE